MKSPVRSSTRTNPLAPDHELLDREGRILLDGKIASAVRGDYAEAVRLNSLRLGLAERRRVELFRPLAFSRRRPPPARLSARGRRRDAARDAGS